jgi:hypothetical protein
MKTIAIVLLALLLMAMPCMIEAKDYKEIIGPYEISFKLPDEIASQIEVNKTITHNETLSGILYNQYSIKLLTARTSQYLGELWINNYNESRTLDPDGTIEIHEGLGKGKGYTCTSDHRIIDGHDGIIVHCFGSERYTERYTVVYQQDNHTTVGGVLYLDWDTAVLPFLKSLHVVEQ